MPSDVLQTPNRRIPRRPYGPHPFRLSHVEAAGVQATADVVRVKRFAAARRDVSQSDVPPLTDRATLLIVDDQSISLHTLYQVFKDEYTVMVATSGSQAIGMCQTSLPDLILLDVMMPGMDGYDVCRQLKANDKTAHIPVIFVTANATVQEEVACLTAGAVDFISKPVNPLVVRSRVKTHIALKQQADHVRQSNEELIFAQRLGRVGSWTWHKVSGTAACSEQLCSMLGIVAEQAGLGLAQLRAAFAPASWFTVLRALAKAQKGAPTLGMELAHTRPDGATGWLLCNVEPVWSGRGQITAVRGTALNITERMQLDHLRAAKDAAELASEHKTRFLSSMSHELRTPLNAVLGFAQVLTMSSLVQGDVSTKTSVQHVLSAGQHLLAMVDDILDLAGIESGKIDLQPEYVDLAQVITECVDMTTMDALGRGLNVDVRVPERPLMVAGNGRRLRQIVLNLLSNGIKYNKPHGDLMVESRCSGGVVQVSVTDTGKGLSPAQQACLFEPFNRLGAENSTVPGTGIGLVLTQRLAQAMNARIEFSSALGQGSTFTLVIPQVTP